MDRTSSVCSPLLDSVPNQSISAIKGGCFDTVPIITDRLYGIRAVFSIRDSLLTLFFFLLLKPLITQILCQCLHLTFFLLELTSRQVVTTLSLARIYFRIKFYKNSLPNFTCHLTYFTPILILGICLYVKADLYFFIVQTRIYSCTFIYLLIIDSKTKNN